QKGIIQPKVALPVVPDDHKINIVLPDDPDLPPQAPAPVDMTQANVDRAAEEEARRIRQLKLQRLEKAIASKTNIENIKAPRSAESSSQEPSDRQAMLARIAEVRRKIAQEENNPGGNHLAQAGSMNHSGAGDGGMGGDFMGSEDYGDPYGDSGGNRRANNNMGQFDKQGSKDRWALNTKTKQPRSPFSLQTGFVIPATLISGINSELPGQITAQVSQDVYDTSVGRYKLIPQGSRLVGAYSSDVVFGQGRLLVAWQRIIFPDGKTRDIGAMPGSAGAGYAGFNDKVNNHYFRIFGSALLMSAVIAGATYSQRDSGGVLGRQSAGSVLSQSLGQQLGRVTTMLMRKNLNIAPTLEIRPGYRFNVVVTKDLVFKKPYQAFDY
nr:conjugal transfer protein TrbI [Gammaproteobacteria bacterium]